jgi:hypothetical protein
MECHGLITVVLCVIVIYIGFRCIHQSVMCCFINKWTIWRTTSGKSNYPFTALYLLLFPYSSLSPSLSLSIPMIADWWVSLCRFAERAIFYYHSFNACRWSSLSQYHCTHGGFMEYRSHPQPHPIHTHPSTSHLSHVSITHL